MKHAKSSNGLNHIAGVNSASSRIKHERVAGDSLRKRFSLVFFQ